MNLRFELIKNELPRSKLTGYPQKAASSFGRFISRASSGVFADQNKEIIIGLIILGLGFFLRLFLVSQNNFIFHMDNARDMVDLREMMVLHKLRLIGPTSGIEGLFDGPAWYYLMAIPFILTQGNPYGLIFFQILLWFIGGVFLYLLIKKWGILVLSVGLSVWVSSNILLLSSQNALSPNGVILLYPMLIYLLQKSLKTSKLIWWCLTWGLAGIFFQFEMAIGIFIPLAIIFSVLFYNRKLINKQFFIGGIFFLLNFIPQIVFDLKHNFLLSKALSTYITNSPSDHTNIFVHVGSVLQVIETVYSAVLMNNQLLMLIVVILIFPGIFLLLKSRQKDTGFLAGFSLLVISLLGFLLIPFNVMPWHIAGCMVSVIFLMCWGLQYVKNKKLTLGVFVGLIIIFISINNSVLYIKNKLSDSQKNDPSLYSNEINAIDYVYKAANGKNFKVYVYLPSVIDYSYQYLFWWYGQRRYGYQPKDYAYLPNKPEYIQNKSLLITQNDLPDSNLTFLIKELNRPDLMDLWQNSFKELVLVKTEQIGPLTIETRRND